MAEPGLWSQKTYPLQSFPPFQSSRGVLSAPSQPATNSSSVADPDRADEEAPWTPPFSPLQLSPRQSDQQTDWPSSPNPKSPALIEAHPGRASGQSQGLPSTYPVQVVPTQKLAPTPPSTPARSGTGALGDASSDRWTYPSQENSHIDPPQAPSPPKSPHAMLTAFGARSATSEASAVSLSRGVQTSYRLRHSYPLQASPPASPQGDRASLPASAKPEAEAASAARQSADEVPRLPRNIRALQDGQNEKVLGRTIVICLDGTGDKFDGDNSNIVHLVSCLKKSDPSQITYYQSGIGTYDGGGLSNGFNAALDMAIGSGLGVHIRDAYHFLMQNYKEHDRICLFGFSRGAYTARCLAGMVHKVGLLPAHNIQQIPFAYQYYKDDSELGWKMSGEFKRTFCMDVSVHFIGVFDSVSSVGFIPRTLPLSSTPWNKATYFRHAMALDEHRAKFEVKQFEKKDSISPDSHWETVAEVHENAVRGHPTRKFSANLGIDKTTPVVEKADDGEPIQEKLYREHKRQQEHAKETDVLEVWFIGAHADVGGGAVKNEERHKLAQVPLRWMIRQCFECNTGIIFSVHRLAEEGLDVHTLWPTYTSLGVPLMRPSPTLMDKHKDGRIAPIARRSSVLKPVNGKDPPGLHDVVLWKDGQKREMHEDWVPEHVEDYFDSISRINDQLVIAKGWWILEIWPVKIREQLQDSEEWVKKVSMNLGRYRASQETSPNMHWTVQQRVEAMGYMLNVRTDRMASWNVVA